MPVSLPVVRVALISVLGSLLAVIPADAFHGGPLALMPRRLRPSDARLLAGVCGKGGLSTARPLLRGSPPGAHCRFPVLRMSDGASDGGDALAQAEAALEDAVASNDVNGISKWMKKIESLQGTNGGTAGTPPPQKMSKEEEAAAIEELLGRLDDGVAEDVAAAITATALDDLTVEAKVAETALDEAIAAGDAPAIASATRRLDRLRSMAGADEPAAPVDKSEIPGTDVERDLAEALEQAALDEGDDVDDMGLLEDLPLADLETRVEAARRLIQEAVDASDAQALSNHIAVLGRLLGTAATSEALAKDDNLAAVEEALRVVGLEVASAQAANAIVEALIAALADEGDEVDLSDDDDDELADGAVDSGGVVAAAGAVLQDAVSEGNVDAMQDAVQVLPLVCHVFPSHCMPPALCVGACAAAAALVTPRGIALGARAGPASKCLGVFACGAHHGPRRQ